LRHTHQIVQAQVEFEIRKKSYVLETNDGGQYVDGVLLTFYKNEDITTQFISTYT